MARKLYMNVNIVVENITIGKNAINAKKDTLEIILMQTQQKLWML